MTILNERVQYWVDLSDYDFETADAMLSTQRYLYVGFMCHQTIEKILKAYYVSFVSDAPPHTHSLSLLASRTDLYNQMSEEQKSFLDILEPLNIEARYPTYKGRILESLTHTRCEQIILKTKELSQWIRKQF